MGTSNLIEALEPRRLFAVPAGFSETRIGPAIPSTTTMSLAPDGRIFVAQQTGQLRVVKNGQLLDTPFLSLTVDSAGERGLLAFTFDPNFTSNRFVYVGYTLVTPDGKTRNRISRFTASSANPDVSTGSELVLLDLDPVGTSLYHNIGSLHFGKDGKLYASVGENFTTSYAQNLGNLFGKMLRINGDGTIPTDNPFYSQTTGRNRAIWAIGLRNPFSFAIQPGTGRMFINDVGISSYEEINEGQAGANYGWPATQGPTTNPAYKTPFYADAHENVPDYALAGGAFYNPQTATFPSQYVGDYFFGNWGTDVIDRLDVSTKTVTRFATGVDQIVDIDVAPDGALYYLLQHKGVFRVQPTATAAPVIATHPQDETVAKGQPVTFAVTASGTGLNYQWQRNGANIAGATSASFTLDPAALADDGDAFRVVVTNGGGSVTSNAATLAVIDDDPPTATILTPEAGTDYAGGTTISFTGSGTDAKDGDLSASAFTWDVRFHHDTHDHAAFGPLTGATGGSFTVPVVGETSDNVWYRIHLTVTDSAGLTHSTYRDVHPRVVNIGLATNVPGLKLTLDGTSVDAPLTTPSVVGVTRSIGAPATQTLDGKMYEFSGWSDGGAIVHDVATPDTDTTYTATYVESAGVAVALRAAADSYVRNGTYASTNFGAATELLVKQSPTSGNTRESYLRFNLTGLGEVGSAKLRFFGLLSRTTEPTVLARVYGVSNATWSETGITWNNKPASGSSLGDVTVAGTTPQWYELDVTGYVRQQKLAGASAVSFAIKAPVATDAWVVMNSDEASSNRVELAVVHTPATAPPPAPAPIVLNPPADAYVRNGASATANFGNDATLLVKRSATTGNTREAYLRFDLSTVGSVGSAKLRLFGRLSAAMTSGLPITLYAVSNTTWSETAITWNTKPAAGSALGTKTITGRSGQWYEWDVTAYVATQRGAGATAVSFALKAPNTSDPWAIFNSGEASGDRPVLTITA